MSCRVILIVALTLWALCSFTFVPEANAYPSNCYPNAGAVYECTQRYTLPWILDHNTCDVHIERKTEAEALQDEIQDDWGAACGLETERLGWLTGSSFSP